MSEAVLQAHLQLASQRAKAYTNKKAVEFNTAVVGALEEMAELKADQAATTTALGGKADKVSGATSGNLASFDANGNLTDAAAVRAITASELSAIISNVYGGNA